MKKKSLGRLAHIQAFTIAEDEENDIEPVKNALEMGTSNFVALLYYQKILFWSALEWFKALYSIYSQDHFKRNCFHFNF